MTLAFELTRLGHFRGPARNGDEARDGSEYSIAEHRSVCDGLRKAGVKFCPLPRWIVSLHDEHEKRLRGAAARKLQATEIGYELYHKNLNDFQRRGVDFIVSREFRCLLADDMGTGKTVQALCAACYFRHQWPVLVLCPKNALAVWEGELDKWLGNKVNKQKIDKGSDNVSRVDFVIMTHDLAKQEKLQKQGNGEPFKMVIVDEAHKAKNDQAQRSQVLRDLSNKATAGALWLSGTPMENTSAEARAALKNSFPKMSDADFKMRYVGSNNTSIRCEELNALLDYFTIRRTKEEVMGDRLPPKNRRMIPCFLDAETIRSNGLEISDAEAADIDRSIELTKQLPENSNVMARYKKTAVAKIPFAQSKVMELCKSKDPRHAKMLLFHHHELVGDGLVEALQDSGVGFVRINGKTSSREREKCVQGFQERLAIRAAVLSITACGEALTMIAAHYALFAEFYWKPSSLRQAEDRMHRIGQTKPVTIDYLCAIGTLDERIFGLLNNKEAVISTVLDGARRLFSNQQWSAGPNVGHAAPTRPQTASTPVRRQPAGDETASRGVSPMTFEVQPAKPSLVAPPNVAADAPFVMPDNGTDPPACTCSATPPSLLNSVTSPAHHLLGGTPLQGDIAPVADTGGASDKRESVIPPIAHVPSHQTPTSAEAPAFPPCAEIFGDFEAESDRSTVIAAEDVGSHVGGAFPRDRMQDPSGALNGGNDIIISEAPANPHAIASQRESIGVSPFGWDDSLPGAASGGATEPSASVVPHSQKSEAAPQSNDADVAQALRSDNVAPSSSHPQGLLGTISPAVVSQGKLVFPAAAEARGAPRPESKSWAMCPFRAVRNAAHRIIEWYEGTGPSVSATEVPDGAFKGELISSGGEVQHQGSPRFFHNLVDEIARVEVSRICVEVFQGDSCSAQLSYSELASRSLHLAVALCQQQELQLATRPVTSDVARGAVSFFRVGIDLRPQSIHFLPLLVAVSRTGGTACLVPWAADGHDSKMRQKISERREQIRKELLLDINITHEWCEQALKTYHKDNSSPTSCGNTARVLGTVGIENRLPFCLAHTSGTRGSEKCAAITHAMFVHESDHYPALFFSDLASDRHSPERLACSPHTYWAASTLGQISLALALRGTCVFLSTALPEEELRGLHSARVSIMGLAPAAFKRYLAVCDNSFRCCRKRYLHDLHTLIFWGEALPPSYAKAVNEVEGVRTLDLLTATEYWLCLVADYEEGRESLFRSAAPQLDAKILVDEDDTAGRHGVLHVAGSLVSSGYFEADRKTILPNSSSWVRLSDKCERVRTLEGVPVARGKLQEQLYFCTGDRVEICEDGRLRLCGRDNFRIKIRGEYLDLSLVRDEIARKTASPHMDVQLLRCDSTYHFFVVERDGVAINATREEAVPRLGGSNFVSAILNRMPRDPDEEDRIQLHFRTKDLPRSVDGTKLAEKALREELVEQTAKERRIEEFEARRKDDSRRNGKRSAEVYPLYCLAMAVVTRAIGSLFVYGLSSPMSSICSMALLLNILGDVALYFVLVPILNRWALCKRWDPSADPYMRKPVGHFRSSLANRMYHDEQSFPSLSLVSLSCAVDCAVYEMHAADSFLLISGWSLQAWAMAKLFLGFWLVRSRGLALLMLEWRIISIYAKDKPNWYKQCLEKLAHAVCRRLKNIEPADGSEMQAAPDIICLRGADEQLLSEQEQYEKYFLDNERICFVMSTDRRQKQIAKFMEMSEPISGEIEAGRCAGLIPFADPEDHAVAEILERRLCRKVFVETRLSHLDSLDRVALLNELRKKLACSVPAALAFQCETAGEMVALVRDYAKEGAREGLAKTPLLFRDAYVGVEAGTAQGGSIEVSQLETQGAALWFVAAQCRPMGLSYYEIQNPQNFNLEHFNAAFFCLLQRHPLLRVRMDEGMAYLRFVSEAAPVALSLGWSGSAWESVWPRCHADSIDADGNPPNLVPCPIKLNAMKDFLDLIQRGQGTPGHWTTGENGLEKWLAASGRAAPLKVAIIATKDEKRAFVVLSAIHAIADAVTMQTLATDLFEMYQSLVSREAGALASGMRDGCRAHLSTQILQERLLTTLRGDIEVRGSSRVSLRGFHAYKGKRSLFATRRELRVQGVALQALRRLADVYNIPLDRLLFALAVAAERRVSRRKDPMTYTLYVPMRDQEGTTDAVGLFVDFRDLTLFE
ncbi:unnamed protein product [Amoebophrya sp. A25]|nr:unnamed protein product [Amoebophrya sp. A25]|eukprot:GSA25T00025124001.1